MTKLSTRPVVAAAALAALASLAAGPAPAWQEAPAAAPADEPTAAGATLDRQALLDHLAHTRQMFLGAVAGLTEEQATWKPAEDRWSVAEVAEHIALSEEFILSSIAGMFESEAPAEALAGAAQDGKVLTFVVDRTQRFQSPEPVAAKGSWTSLAETVAAFEVSREKTVALAEETDDLRAYAQEHPAFGSLDAMGWIAFLSGHVERHTKQIEEVKASDGFPAG